MRISSAFVLLSTILFPSASNGDETRIVSWNMGPGMYESVLNRGNDLRKLDKVLKPDVLVLIEMAGIHEVREIARLLGWPTYYAAVSDGLELSTATSFALETAVISKVPIVSVVEYDAEPEPGDSDGIQLAITNNYPWGDTSIPISEVKLNPATGVPGIDTNILRTDRGPLRVDLANGLTIFPVHLKSNLNDICTAVDGARDNLRKVGLPALPALDDIWNNGSDRKAKADTDNALKRERVIAAVKLEADAAVADGRHVVIAGDYNTSFEPGKFGQSATSDCPLEPFSCKKAPFPASSCQGDGFDDTFAVLTAPIVGTVPWTILTKGLGRTFEDTAFGDFAIDHFAVPSAIASRFTNTAKATELFGSDHFAIVTVYSNP